MPYALFSNDVQVSKSFSSKSEVWRHAADSGLVLEVGSREEDPPRRILDMGYTIRQAGTDQIEPSVAPGMSEHEITRLIAACTPNRPTATAAS